MQEAEPEQQEQAKAETPDQGFKTYNLKFKDVIGLSEQKAFIRKVIELPIKQAEVFKEQDIHSSTGVILYGPPGVGKTVLMEAISGELNLKMMDIKIGEVLSKYIGEPEKKIMDIFAKARANQPCILFFDELDVLAASRDSGGEGYGAELKSITSAFLKEISVVAEDKESLVFLVGATNRIFDIDSAMKRGGRFEHLIYVRPPNIWERRRLFKYYLKGREGSKHMGRIEYFWIALATIGYSPADIKKIAKLAKIGVIDRINKSGKKTLLTTRYVLKALKDKTEGRNSLDEWYITMKNKYIGPQKYRRETKFLLPIGKKVTIGKEPTMSKEDRETYKEMCKDVNHYMKYRNWFKLFRFIARGI